MKDGSVLVGGEEGKVSVSKEVSVRRRYVWRRWTCSGGRVNGRGIMSFGVRLEWG